ncbi:HD-GYP domain-containing protein [Methylovulum psychrotolerans]|uniref:HD-GYP domain-containing protein n=1 Tax=Methylovulum psychrotolerans TaxID=1704499 RepID=A0A1Z4C118_9GAMM|nr:HD-GYP domain-containing protein [Methylovulum psychrotolerans]ASF47223.1 hypothetical protein CEK71_14740 [Methylovulum psychrotolerans]
MIEIDTKKLVIGMYVARLDRPWLETSFLFQGFRIENNHQIEQLQTFCKTVKIDEEQSSPLVSFEAFKPSTGRLNGTPPPPTAAPQDQKARFYEDMAQAKSVYDNVSGSLNKVLTEFRLNNYIAIPEVKSCVQSVIGNIMHNPNALVLLSNLRSKHQHSAKHSVNTCIYATLFGRYLAFNPEQLATLSTAALLHDVGEIMLPKTIVDKKPDELTAEEIAQLQLHTQYGADMLRKITELPAEVAEVAHSHHERIDGNGYPRGLKETEITLMAKIIGIINEYERLTNNPNPKLQLSSSDALKAIYALRDSCFDAGLVEGLIKCLGIYPIGSVVLLNNGSTGIVIGMRQDNHLLPTVMIIRDPTGELRHPPKAINLDKFRDKEGKPILLISKVLEVNSVDDDLRDYILAELVTKNKPM